MARSLGVLSVLQGPDEVSFVQAVEALTPTVVIARRCGDVAELLAAAHAGIGRIAVVSADLPGLDRDTVATLLGAGVHVVAVADPPEGWLAERTRALGISSVTAPDGAIAAVSAAARQILGGDDDARAANGSTGGAELPSDAGDHAGTGGREAATGGRDQDAVDLDPVVSRGLGIDGTARAGSVDDLGDVQDPLAVDAVGTGGSTVDAEPGSVIAIWGPTGAPGRTTLAVNLAAEFAVLSTQGALLVDADTYGGTVAQVLGMLDEAPGIAAAARAAGQGTLDAAALSLLAPVASDGLRVVSGISRASRWAEIPGPSLDVVWDVARAIAEWTVVDCGFGVEDDEALSYDTRAPRRNAATLSALAAADLVVVVGAADPIGVQRLVRSLGDLDALGLPGSRVVIANKVRASAVGPRPGDLIAAALERYAGVGDVRLVPDDRSALDAAVLRGAALREVAPGSAARKAIVALAEDLAAARAERLAARDGDAPARRRRAGRRAAARS